MKKIVFAALALLASTQTLAYDEWRAFKFGNEVVYRTGRYERIFIGERGVGYSTASVAFVAPSDIVVTIDNEPPQRLKTSSLSGGQILFQETEPLKKKIMAAKRVEFKTRYFCNLECKFSVNGESYDPSDIVVWEFEKSLNQEIASGKIEVVTQRLPE